MRINLLPLARQKKPDRLRLQVIGLIGGLAIIAGLIWYSVHLMSSVNALQDEQARLTTRIAELAPIAALLDEQAALERELAQVLAEAIPPTIKLTPVIDELVRLMPDSVSLTALSVGEQGLMFSGTAPSHAVAASFLRALAGSEMFAEPMIGGLTRGDGGYGFSITLGMRVVAP